MCSYSLGINFSVQLQATALDSLGIGAYLFGSVVMKDIRDQIQSFNGMLETKTARSKLMAHVCEYIRFSYLRG